MPCCLVISCVEPCRCDQIVESLDLADISGDRLLELLLVQFVQLAHVLADDLLGMPVQELDVRLDLLFLLRVDVVADLTCQVAHFRRETSLRPATTRRILAVFFRLVRDQRFILSGLQPCCRVSGRSTASRWVCFHQSTLYLFLLRRSRRSRRCRWCCDGCSLQGFFLL